MSSANGSLGLSDPNNKVSGNKSLVELGFEGSHQHSYETLNESAKYICSLTKLKPKIAIICGSGLASLGKKVDIGDGGTSINYQDIPYFPNSTAPGHRGIMTIGTLTDDKIPVICMQGRFHLYEGYTAWTVAMPIRVLKLIGVEVLIVTNAAGGLADDLHLGDIMIIKDHVNFPGFSGVSPLRGPNDPMFGVRFTAMNNAYDQKFRGIAKEIGREMKIEHILKEGIYGQLGGPAYETPAELRMFKAMGIDAIGMSTVQEIVAARHCNMRCMAFSIISNIGVFGYDTTDMPSEQDVIVTAQNSEKYLHEFITRFLTKVNLDLSA